MLVKFATVVIPVYSRICPDQLVRDIVDNVLLYIVSRNHRDNLQIHLQMAGNLITHLRGTPIRDSAQTLHGHSL